MSCDDCVQRAAGTMTRICGDMTPSLARQLFPVLFPSEVCGRMSGSFVQAVARQQETESVPRRMPGREIPRREAPVREPAVFEMPRAAAAVA